MSLTPSRVLFDEFLAKSPEKKSAEKPGDLPRKSNFRVYLGLLAGYRSAFARIFIAAVLTELLYLAVPITTRHIIDGVLMRPGLADAQKQTLLIQIGLVLFGTLVAAQGLDFWRRFYTVLVNGRFVRVLRLKLFSHLMIFPWAASMS
ncbi:MAG: hypothetical protein KF713_01060 [Turneriella sp.]|nr:hypothetical protein [Turneriella sp.]